MLQKVLIANRGEIACRIIHSCHKFGLATVAVYSAADTHAKHVQLADEAVYIGPAPATKSYLNTTALITAAQQTNANAIHPGYGFLAENADFARACAQANLTFVGPPPEAIEAMGNKRAAKQLMADSGVPTLPGYTGSDQSDQALITAAKTIGFPLMVKAAAGGGGKGMRLVHNADALPEALITARRESQQAFGSDELILERALLQARHIEVQVFGDNHGRIIHLGERDCSIQRRHQKVIEEAPAVGITPQLRAALGAAAVQAAQSVDYTNAGTVEFLLAPDGNFYFLEMNTRIQVEHPVTEAITGVDLVEWQLRIANNEPLPLTQEAVTWQGHAIEVRLYAENPANNFLPVTGQIALWREPVSEGIRVDSGLLPQDEVTIHYDPMLAKLIAHAPDRQTAVRRLLRALTQTRLLGLTHNAPFLQALLQHHAFLAGKLSTTFIADHVANWHPPRTDPTPALIATSICQYWAHPRPTTNTHHWRNSPNRPLHYPFIDHPTVAVTPHADHFHCTIGDQTYHVTAVSRSPNQLTLTINAHRRTFTTCHTDGQWWIATNEGTTILTPQSLLPKPQPPAGAGGSLRAPMPGIILELFVKEGDSVEAGQALLKLEAMKMEHTIRSTGSGVITAVFFSPGSQVKADAQLLTIDNH